MTKESNNSKKDKVINVLVGVCYYDHIEPKCEASIQALKNIPGFKFTYVKLKGSEITKSRNLLLKNNMDEAYDLFLGVDADIEFTVEHFLEMYKQNKPAVFGSYINKDSGLVEAGYFLKDFPGVVDKQLTVQSKVIFEVDYTGLGFYLLTRKCISDIGYPLYDCPVIDLPDGTKDVVQEDAGFCMRLARRGITLTFMADVRVTHLYREDDQNLLNKKGIIQLMIPQQALSQIIECIKKSPTLNYENADSLLKNIAKQVIPQTNKQNMA